MNLHIIKLALALAVLVVSTLYFEGYLGDRRDGSTGTRTCRRPPAEVRTWSNHVSKFTSEHRTRLAEWAREHPGDLNRSYGVWCRTPLHAAAVYGREDAAALLLAHGADVWARDEHGDTSLHLAAWNGHPALVRLLLANGADVDARDEAGMTALHEVMTTTRGENVLQSRLAIARALLDAGANPNAPAGSSGFTALRYAVGPQGHPALVRLLLDRGAAPRETASGAGSELHDAAFHGDLESVRLLVESGADTDAADAMTTPLGYAASHGHLEVVSYLLDHGADPARTGTASLLPWRGSPLEMALLSSSDAGDAGRRLEIASLLVESGAVVDVRGTGGRTLLHGAAEEGDLTAARFLLDHGAEVDAADATDLTPLHAAVEQGHLEMSELLLVRGADPGARTADGATPRSLARLDPELEEMIIRHGGS